MSRRPITELSVDAAYRRLQADAAHRRFEAAMNSGAPIVDNASDRLWGPNGQPDDQPERPDGECGFCGGVGTVDDGDRLCQICRGAGGWQQHDGLIVECPRGCMTGGAA